MTSSSNGEVIVHVFGRTDVGRAREHNEDSFVVADLSADNATLQPEVRTHVTGPKGTLFMVADGMGGAAAGEIASAMATDLVLNELRAGWVERPDSSPELFARAIKDAAKTANSEINQYALSHPEYRGMGTTATIAGLLGDTLYVAQVGDSRGYLIREGEAVQITKDQSLMQKLVEAGEAEAHARRHARHHFDWFKRAEAEWAMGPHSSQWLNENGRRVDDVRSALNWAFSPEGDATVGVALTIASLPLWLALSLVRVPRAYRTRSCEPGAPAKP
jgi:serine/threonine protein phosphatase PrpC